MPDGLMNHMRRRDSELGSILDIVVTESSLRGLAGAAELR